MASGRAIFDATIRRFRPRPPERPRIRRCRRPSLEDFAAFRRAAEPVLLDGLLDDWSVRDDLTLERLRDRFGDRRLPVLETHGGNLVCDPDTGVSFDTVRFRDYLDRVLAGEPANGYLATPVLGWLPELAADLPVPPYCRDAPWRNLRMWVSAADTAVPLHRDVAQNIFCQLVGRKRFLLYPAAATPWLYSHPFRSALTNYSRFDPERPDYARFPLSREVEPVDVVLGPGDALYLPTRWWHQVRSLDASLSMSFWWAEGLVAVAVRAAELVKRVRGLEIYGLEQRLRARAAG